MKRSIGRILTSHAGSLSRPEDLRALLTAKHAGEPYDAETFAERVRNAVAEVVRKQIECGIDVVNDGELSKINFTGYARERLSGVSRKAHERGRDSFKIWGRDESEFPEYFAAINFRIGDAVCGGPLKYIGHAAVQADILNLKAALEIAPAAEAFLPAVAPGTIEHWLQNDYYANDEAYLAAIAEAMREEYLAIADAGFILQIDDPDLGDAWQIHPEMDVHAYRKFAELRIDVLNHALRGIPPERIRFHMCWGSYHGPHKYDIPLSDIVDLVLKVNAECYSIEASNPRHEHEWRVWEKVKLPDGKILMPGVAGHASDFVEHPELVAERLTRYAQLVGRENVIAGTDCGLGTRVGHPKIAWAKFEALAEGARIASQRLWGS
ncbi:MAG TPA: cobalamin-independent methionine synthase II family protein [Candidatus Binataceae bacterium]|nr:cobalamin-independent methionine synthase II family protein [Candidatus Binataceae bacterium]